jgi:hypothetical protein
MVKCFPIHHHNHIPANQLHQFVAVSLTGCNLAIQTRVAVKLVSQNLQRRSCCCCRCCCCCAQQGPLERDEQQPEQLAEALMAGELLLTVCAACQLPSRHVSSSQMPWYSVLMGKRQPPASCHMQVGFGFDVPTLSLQPCCALCRQITDVINIWSGAEGRGMPLSFCHRLNSPMHTGASTSQDKRITY